MLESSQRLLRDYITSLLEPVQEKIQQQEERNAEINALKCKIEQEKEFYEDIIRQNVRPKRRCKSKLELC